MKPLLILGHSLYDRSFADIEKTLEGLSEFDVELWVLNNFHRPYGTHWYPPTRIFNIHSCEQYQKMKVKGKMHDTASTYNRTGARVITCDNLDDFDKQERYPVEYVKKYTANFFSSSASYMLAMAMEERFNPVYLYGFQMMSGQNEEYFHQLPQMRYGIRMMRDNGVKVYAEFESDWKHLCPKSDIRILPDIEKPYIFVDEYRKAAGIKA